MVLYSLLLDLLLKVVCNSLRVTRIKLEVITLMKFNSGRQGNVLLKLYQIILGNYFCEEVCEIETVIDRDIASLQATEGWTG